MYKTRQEVKARLSIAVLATTLTIIDQEQVDSTISPIDIHVLISSSAAAPIHYLELRVLHVGKHWQLSENGGVSMLSCGDGTVVRRDDLSWLHLGEYR